MYCIQLTISACKKNVLHKPVVIIYKSERGFHSPLLPEGFQSEVEEWSLYGIMQ